MMANRFKHVKECIENSALISNIISQNNNKTKMKEIEENMVYLRNVLTKLMRNNEKDDKMEKTISSVNVGVRKMMKIFENEDKWELETYLNIFDLDYILKIQLNELNHQYLNYKINTEEEIKDAEGKKFWKEKFGKKKSVKKDKFMKEMNKYFGDLNEKILQSLDTYLDSTKEGRISIFQFQRFLELLGPFEKLKETLSEMVQNNINILQIPSLRAEYMLLNKPQGSYLLRFSKSRSDSFAISYIDGAQSVKHTLIIKNNYKYHIKGCTELFSTISELLEFYSKKLFLPVEMPSTKEQKREDRKSKTIEKKEKENSVDHYKNDILKNLRISTNKASQSNNACSICLKRNKDTILDCQHFVSCFQCSKKLKLCPLCNTIVRNPHHLFIL